MGTVAQHQVTTFVSPANGQTPIDATVVRGNDNTIRSNYNTHDADTTIHLQNGIVSTRPAASITGQMWLSSDTGAVYLYLDTGSAWVEANYLRSTGGTVTGALTVTGTTTLAATTIAYSSAALTINATAGVPNVVMQIAGVAAVSLQASSASTFRVLDAGSTPILTVAGGVLTVPSGLVVTAGGATITAGGATITAGGATITAGDLIVTAGFGRFGSMATTNATAPTLCLTSTTAPTGNPVGGGFLYVVSGVLVYRGPSGTITTLAVS